MTKKIKNQITAKGFEVSVLTQNQSDYISLTDIAKYKNQDDPRIVISNWMSSYSTIDFLATWEEIHNPDFNRMEFHTVRNERGRLVMTPSQWIKNMGAVGIRSSAGRYGGTYAHVDIAFGMTAKEFREKHPEKKGNQRDNATIEQNIVMASLESSNALLIKQGMEQSDRLVVLRELAIEQLTSILKSKGVEVIKSLAGGVKND